MKMILLMKHALLRGIPALALCGAFTAAAASFRVEPSNGVPQLTRDGTPVRSRMLWVHTFYSAGATELRPEWTDTSFEFTSRTDCPVAALHLRFGEDTGAVSFSRIDIDDLTSGKTLKSCRFDGNFKKDWKFWCAGINRKPPVTFTEESGILTVRLNDDPRLRGFHLYLPGLSLKSGHRYRVAIRGRADAPRAFKPTVHRQEDNHQLLGGLPSPLQEEVKLAAKSEIDLVSFKCTGIWVRPGEKPDYSDLDRFCRLILAANPDAYLLPRIKLDPPNWWVRENPDDLMKFDNGKPGSVPSLASQKYRTDAAQALRLVIEYCEKNFPGHMAGYHPAGGNTDEWFYVGAWDKPLNGYDPATLRAWRQWLKTKYRTDAALRKAWNNPAVAIGTAEIPSAEERRGTPQEGLRIRTKDAATLDFTLFQQDTVADTVLALARIVRETAGPERLSVFFYGYLFEFGSVPNGPAISGHYALRRILASPDIDILAAPLSYRDRQPGGGATTMTAAESVMLAGKLWFNEDDTRTHIAARTGSRAPGWQDGARTQAESILLLRRNLAFATARNYGTWWMDLGGTGWFNDPALWNVMDEFKPIETAELKHPVPYRPEMALLTDDVSVCHVVATGVAAATTDLLLSQSRANLNRVGAPCGQYLLDDLLMGRISPKLNVFAAAYALGRNERTRLHELAQTSGGIWCWAPGYVDLDKGSFSTEAVRETTGFAVEALADAPLRVRSTTAGKQLGLPDEFGPEAKMTPVLAVRPEKGDAVLAVYRDGNPAVVLRPGKAPQLFCGTTELPVALLRHMAKLSGVHLDTDRPANVYANGDFLAVSAPEEGVYRIGSKQIRLEKGETVILRQPR